MDTEAELIAVLARLIPSDDEMREILERNYPSDEYMRAVLAQADSPLPLDVPIGRLCGLDDDVDPADSTRAAVERDPES
jgi:hypothetical protein